MSDIVKKLLFYLIVAIPAYALIVYGLKGLGYLQTGYYNSMQQYNPYNTPSIDIGAYLTNYQPPYNLAPYFLIIGVGMFTGMALRAAAKYSHEDLGMLDMLNVNSEYHDTHCERTAVLVYAGIGAIIASLIIVIYFNAQFGSNLLILFGISMVAGVGALLWYRKEHEKWPWG